MSSALSGRSHMTSEKIWNFSTPPVTVPIMLPISTVVYFLANILAKLTSYVNGPLCERQSRLQVAGRCRRPLRPTVSIFSDLDSWQASVL